MRGPRTLDVIFEDVPSSGVLKLGIGCLGMCPFSGSSNFGDGYGPDMASRILEGHDTCHCLELIYRFTAFMHFILLFVRRHVRAF